MDGRTGIAVAFRARGVPAEIPKETALSLYRITQEALRNVEKHAASRDAHVSLDSRPGKGTVIEVRVPLELGLPGPA